MNQPPFERHIWLLFVAITVMNAFILKFRSRRHVQERPELADDYRRFFLGVLCLGNLPWLVMAAGIEFGGVPTMFTFFRPRHGNPFVIAWFATIIGLWLLGFYWLFARRGAEFLIEHPGLLPGEPKSPAMIRAYYCVMVAGGILGLYFMFKMDVS